MTASLRATPTATQNLYFQGYIRKADDFSLLYSDELEIKDTI
jgi:hypothetical protein